MFLVGIIGLGMGRNHAKGVLKVAEKMTRPVHPELDQPVLYALCDIDKEKLRKVTFSRH